MASGLKTDGAKQNKKDEDESGLSVWWWWLRMPLGQGSLPALQPLVLMGLTVSLLLWEGEEQLVGAGLGTEHQALLHPCPSGAAGASHCWAAVVLWLPEQPWEMHPHPHPLIRPCYWAWKRQAKEDLVIVPSARDAKAILVKAPQSWPLRRFGHSTDRGSMVLHRDA